MDINTTRVFDRLVLNHDKRFKILQGGSSSSKNYSILQFFIIRAYRDKSKKRKLISIVAETMPILRRGAMKDFFDILGDKYNKDSHNVTASTYRICNTLFEFFSADSQDRVKGPRRTDLYLNEADNVQYETFYQLEMRTERHVYIDYNPSKEFWIHTKLIPMLEPSDFFFDISTYRDNPYAPVAAVKSIERRKFKEDGVTITEYYKVYGLGQTGSLEGAIYEKWKIDRNGGGVWAEQEGWIYGLDFGFSVDPAALLKVKVKNGRIWVKELLYERELTNADLVKRFIKMKIPKTAIIYADSAEPKSIEELNRAGYCVRPALKGADSLRMGIDWLKSRELTITAYCTHLVKELRNYVWDKDRSGKSLNSPADGDDHLMDALRYALSPMIRRMTIEGRKMGGK